ncbi:MAG: dTMP kinase [Planctomycetales bacterium]
MFFSLDGMDGVGKSTQLELFVDHLKAIGHDVVLCRDPGSTQLGEAIRDILLKRSETPISNTSEMLLYMAARAQLVQQVIKPALAAGKTVVSDRYLLANVVYQAHAGDGDAETVWQVGEVATDGLMPDLTLVLDMAADVAGKRLGSELDRMESRGDEYRGRLRAGFLAEAARNPQRIEIVPAEGTIAEVHQRIVEVTARYLESTG